MVKVTMSLQILNKLYIYSFCDFKNSFHILNINVLLTLFGHSCSSLENFKTLSI